MQSPQEANVKLLSLGKILGLLMVFCILSLYWCNRPLSAEDFELLPVFKASKVVPADLLQGTNFRLQEQVRSDGFNYLFDLQTDYGPLQVESLALLKIRVAELAAIARMQKLEQTDEFREALSKTAQETGKNTMNLAKGLVTAPVETVSGVASGIGSYLGGLGRSLSGAGKSGGEQDESTWKKVIGFAKAKREVAFEFKVDPYSNYQVLQDQLDRIAWAVFAGGKSISLPAAAIPGGVGTVLSATKFAANMNQQISRKSPAELTQLNADKLRAMGIDEATAERFLEHPQYSPTRKTFVVAALEEMKGVEQRTAFLELAVLASNPDLAFYFQRQAIMYGAYHKQVKPLARFLPLGPYAFAETTDGTLVGLFPIDHLVWTQEMAAQVEGETSKNVKQSAEKRNKVLVFTGTVSKLARTKLAARGWKIEENAAAKLLQ
jgi:hypothetical protein